MATNIEIMTYLRPNGGWVQNGQDYEGIEFVECEPFTKKEYEDAAKFVDQWKKKEEERKKLAKEALLQKLGITQEEANLLLS